MNFTATSSGNFSAATTWAAVEPTSLNNTRAASAASTTAYLIGVGFTPGAVTVDGIGMQFLNRSGSSGGTVSVRISQGGTLVPGTEVTININDFPATVSGWVFFKFSAPVTLLAATIYTIDLRTSVASSVSYFRSVVGANTFSRYLRTTTTGSPTAGQVLSINGDHTAPGVSTPITVTIDSVLAPAYGAISVGSRGVLNSGAAPSTNYQLSLAGNLQVTGGGLVELGNSVTPIPASSTSVLQVNQLGVNVSFGILLESNAIFRTFGAAKLTRAFLAADAAVAATTLTTNVATGWLAGDEVVLAPTGNVAAQFEIRALTVNASGTTLTIPATTFGHLGTGDFIAEVANVTHNVKVRSDSASFATYLLTGADTVCDFNNTEFTRMGSATAGRRGMDLGNVAGSFNMVGCSMHRFNTGALPINLANANNNNVNIDDCVIYNVAATLGINVGANNGTNFTFNDIWGFNATFGFGLSRGTITGLRVSGSGTPITINPNVATGLNLTVSDLVAHSNSAAGLALSPQTIQSLTVSNVTTWRNVRGINVSGSNNLILINHTSYGNSFGLAVGGCVNLLVEDSTYYGSTGIIQNTGVAFEATGFNHVFNNCSFGIPTPHTTGDINFPTARAWHDTKFNNCLFGSTTEAANLANLAQNAIIGSGRHDQTAGVHRAWRRTATLSSDAVIQSSPPRSLRIAPSVAAQKTLAPVKGFAIPTGLTATVTVAIRRSVAGDGTAYNGALPRLWLRQNNAAGIATDTLLATATAASLGQFEVLTGTIPAATDNTVNYVYVDLDGTAGWVNIDRWTLNINDGTANATNLSTEDFWQDGLPFSGVNTTLTVNTNQESYWLDGVPVQQLYPTSTLQTGRFFAFFQ